MSIRAFMPLALAGLVAGAGYATQLVEGKAQQPNAIAGARCLHREDESRADRGRRESAIALARAIHAAQGAEVRRTRRYQVLTALGSLPPVPDGFVVRLYTDGDGYIFSIKDDRDTCRYGIFSDQHGILYEVSPTLPLIAS